MDIASLGFKIDTSDVAKADSALDGLAATGAKTEAAAQGVGKAWTDAGRRAGAASTQFGSTAPAVKQGNAALKAQQVELGKLLGQINPVVSALGRLDEQEAKLRKFKAGGVVDADTFRDYKAQIDASRASLGGIDTAIRRTGVSSKQSAAALRQLPAQFSDIAISLQAGQSPLSVFLQQGAQIKDSFGGVGPALREVGKYALALVNPFTVAAAAAAVLALAYKQGSDEATAFNTALILTGNAAGSSVGQLQNAAVAMDKVAGTQRQAAQALAEVAGTGKFTSEQILGIASAAVAMEEATGKAIADTVSEFKKLADEPAAAAAKLNEQYNFLTASVYEQITALEQQGDAAGAAQLAIDTFGQVMQDRAAEIENGLGLIERAWKGIKSGAAEAWDEMLGVGRSQTPEQRLDALSQGGGFNPGKIAANAVVLGPLGGAKEIFDQLRQANGGSAERNEQIGELWQEIQDRDEKAWVEGMNAQQQQDAVAAQQRIDQLKKSSLTNAEKRAKALSDLQKDLAKIRQVNPGDERLGASNVARLEANIAEQFKDPKAAAASAFREDAGQRMLNSLREQYAQLVAQDEATKQLTSSQRELVKFQQQIADIKNKQVLTADQKSLLANQDMITAQLKRNAAIENEAIARKEIQKSMDDYNKLTDSLLSKEEKQLQLTRDRFEVLEKTRKNGLPAEEFNKTSAAIVSKSTVEPPKFAGLGDSVGGVLGEIEKIDEAEAELEKWYATQLAMVEQNRADRLGIMADWDDKELALKQQHEDGMARIERARQLAALSSVDSFLGNLTALQQTNSEKGKGIAKTAAIAQTSIKTYESATSAFSAMAGIPIIGPVLGAAAAGAAIAAGLANVAAIRGFRDGGFTGHGAANEVAGLVHKGEYVMTKEATQRLGVGNLEALSAGRAVAMSGASGGPAGSSAGGASPTVNNYMSFPGVTDSKEAKRSTAQASRQIANAVRGASRYA